MFVPNRCSIFMSAITPSIANVTECIHSIHRQCTIEISLVQAILAETLQTKRCTFQMLPTVQVSHHMILTDYALLTKEQIYSIMVTRIMMK